jgi:RNA polymerase sigma factor (sigma-70 family)
VNGNRAQGNNYTIEGADNNEPQNNLIGYNPAPDAIEEVRVVSANANATYGNANGGAIVTILKSGTNSFHGKIYGLVENQNLDANKWEGNLQLAIQQLPEKQRIVFNLRYYDEMPYEEMSRVLETSEGALKASYHHAVKKIEDYMLNH